MDPDASSAANPARTRRRLRAAVGAGLAAALLLMLDPLSSAAPTSAEAPVAARGGAFAVDGHGFGHGRGMSQWGAQGAATRGVNYRQILAAYYPGTALELTSDARRIRVEISADTDGIVEVIAAPGLSLALDRAPVPLPLTLAGLAVTRWRARLVGGAARIEGLTGGGAALWRAVRTQPAGRLEFRPAPAAAVRLVLPGGGARDYRGAIVAVPAGGRLRTVDEVPVGDYLRSVVPAESPASWRPDALRAQAVAARTYALWHAGKRSRPVADICDTTACQAYRGIRTLDRNGRTTRTYEAASTDRAVLDTAGQWLSYRGAPALTEFSASNGGYSVAGGVAYQRARPDPWDGAAPNTAHSWSASIPAARISARWPQIGAVRSLQVLRRDGNGEWGGRVESILIVGTQGRVTVSGATFASRVGIRHRWFQLRG